MEFTFFCLLGWSWVIFLAPALLTWDDPSGPIFPNNTASSRCSILFLVSSFLHCSSLFSASARLQRCHSTKQQCKTRLWLYSEADCIFLENRSTSIKIREGVNQPGWKTSPGWPEITREGKQYRACHGWGFTLSLVLLDITTFERFLSTISCSH